MVEMTGLEPAASASRTQRSTGALKAKANKLLRASFAPILRKSTLPYGSMPAADLLIYEQNRLLKSARTLRAYYLLLPKPSEPHLVFKTRLSRISYRKKDLQMQVFFVVEMTGLEPAASASRTQRSTKLSHISIGYSF